MRIISFSGSLVMDTIYGIEVRPENDPYIEAAEKHMAAQSVATVPGTFLVDFLPICKWISKHFQSTLILHLQ